MPEFVEVYSLATGRKRTVPAHYLDNPRLMAGLSRTPRDLAPEPTESAGSADTPVDPETPAPEAPIDDPETPAAGDQED